MLFLYALLNNNYTRFLDTKGFLIFKHWLVEAKKEKKLPQFVMSLLNVLDHLPIGIDELTKSGLGKVVRVFGKGSFPEGKKPYISLHK